MTDSPFNSAMIRMLAARPAGDFIGRDPDVERLIALAENAARGADAAIAVEGPHGSGKSELLRQLTLALSRRSASSLAVYLDLPTFITPGTSARLAGDSRMQEALFRSLLRQALICTGNLEPHDLQWLDADPSRLAGFCYGAGLGGLAPFAAEGARHLSFAETWRALFGAWRGLRLPPLVLLLDGAAAPDPAVTAALGLILECAQREGCPVIFEAPVEADDDFLHGAPAVEHIPLAPLRPADALALAQQVGQARGWALASACIEPVLERLGPWPGWVRGWAMKVRAGGRSPVRQAEEAYLDFLSSSAWAEGLRRRFERLVPLTLREQALRLIRTALERDQEIAPAEAPAMLGLNERESERVLAGLTRLGLLARCGSRWGAPRTRALADWAGLLIAEDARDTTPAAARMGLLGRLLTLPRPAPESAPSLAAPAVDQLLPALLMRFGGQVLAPVLFHYADYYEAVGRLAPDKRREAVMRATASLRLPEVIGVAEWRPRAGADGAPRIYFGRAYRDGKYQRSHEEVWIALDLSGAKILTTPEIHEALAQADALEASLRPNRFVRWLILGESASAEALELIRGRGYLCSGREQLALIQELLNPAAPPAEPVAPAAPRAPVAPPPPAEPPPAAAEVRPLVRHTIIDLKSPDEELRTESSSLRLPAREGSEQIAALTAEKIAFRSSFDPAQAGQIKTAVLEGVLNAVEHSLNGEKSVDIQFLLTPEALEILIENEGPAFDPLAVPTPDPHVKLTSAHKRGWGLSLMRRFMDEVGYEPCERGTRLRLVKRRRRPQSGGVADTARGTL